MLFRSLSGSKTIPDGLELSSRFFQRRSCPVVVMLHVHDVAEALEALSGSKTIADGLELSSCFFQRRSCLVIVILHAHDVTEALEALSSSKMIPDGLELCSCFFQRRSCPVVIRLHMHDVTERLKQLRFNVCWYHKSFLLCSFQKIAQQIITWFCPVQKRREVSNGCDNLFSFVS